MVERNPDPRSRQQVERNEPATVHIESDHAELDVPRDEVIERLDEIAEAVLPEGAPPQDRAPTEESS